MRERKTTAGKLIDVEEALRTYGDMVYRLALVQMKNRSEAEDVFQEVFLRLVRYRERIEGEQHLKPWLLRVTVNCCNDLCRSAWFKRTAPLEAAPDAAAPVHDGHDELWQAVRALPEDLRTVVWLHYVEGYGTDEIASLVGCRPATVRTRLYRARQKLKLELEGNDDGQPEQLEPNEGYQSAR